MKTKKTKKRMYRLISTVVVSLMLLQSTGCQPEQKVATIEPMELEEVHSYSYDFIGGTDVMPIVAYHVMDSNRYSYNGNDFADWFEDKYFEMAADIGINVLGSTYSYWDNTKQDAITILEKGEKYGLGVMVRDARILQPTQSLEYISSCVSEYMNYPAYCGNFVIDEPAYPGVSTLGTQLSDILPTFEKLAELGVPAYGNLFCTTVKSLEDSSDIATYEAFKAYIKDYVEVGKVQFLGYDMYPFNKYNVNDYVEAQRYFFNLTLFREGAEEHGIAFWTFLQAGAQWNDEKANFDSNGYYPSRGAFNWLANTSLAFGSKGIQYFMLVQPEHFAYAESEPYDFQRNGLIGAFGNKTRWYYYAKDMNAQIAAIDEVLMNSVNKGVLMTCDLGREHMADSQYLMEGTSWRELKNVEGDAMIGCFNYQGKTALYVVNYDMEYAQKITLDLQDTYKVRVIQDAQTDRVTTNSLTLTLSAGNGALVVFE